MSWRRDIPQDPVTAAIVLSAGVSTAATGFAISAGVAGAAWLGGSMIANFLISVALGYALNALTPKPNLNAASGGGYASVNALTPAAATGIIYGATRVGGIPFYQETTNNNKFLHKLIAVAGHEVNAIGDIYLNDELVTLDTSGNVTLPSQYNGKVRLIKHLGTADQAADANLMSESTLWTANHRARGIAYIYARFLYDADAFPNGVPVITTVVQGKKVYDPRTETTAYSSNAALCLRDYLISSGVAFTSEIDDTLFSTAANICDETVTLDAGGTQLRYTTNGTFTSEAAPKDAISNLLTSMGGMIWYSQGKWGCKAAAYTSTVLSLDEDDLRSGLQIQTRNSRRDGFNKITGIFRGPESNYFETNYPTLAPATFLTDDNNQESELELALPYVDTSAMAQRIAKIALYRNREQLKISGSFGMRAYQLSIGDLVQITNTRLGFADKVFEVVEWRFGLNSEMALEVFMTLQELSSGVFEWNADESLFESNNTNLLSPYAVPNVSILANQEYRIVNEKITNILVVNVSSTEAERVDNVEVSYKKQGDESYSILGIGDLGRFEIMDIDTPQKGQPSISYDIRARATNALGVKGEYASINKYVQGDTTPPLPPLSFNKQLSAGTIFFSWSASTSLDLSHYTLHHSSSTTATWADGSVLPVIDKIARPATTVSYPAISGTFFLETYDKYGNGAEQTSDVISIIVLPTDLPQLGTPLEDVENPTFAGTNTNTTVVSSELQLSSYATAPATGTYEFTGYIHPTPSEIRTVRVSNAITVSRHHANAVAGEVNWDDISSSYNWSQWPDSWDTWTDEDANFGDFSVVTYVSATDDDPTIGSPTWGAWTVAAGDKTGRAFKFKAVLSNISNNVTPSISVLKGIVEY